MSPVAQNAKNRRTTARVALVIVAAAMTVFVLFSGGPIGSISFAQQQTSPGVSIKLVNPDDDTSLEISAVNDGVDTKYHLVAWVNTNPSNAVVEFQFQTGTGGFTTVGTATPVGADTWEFFWDVAAMPADNTSGTLKVNLFSGSGTAPIASDQEAVRINNQPPATAGPNDSDTPNAVEITYPDNGGIIGFYPNGAVYQGQIHVKASTNTVDVVTYYTITAPGTDPTWKECGSESRADAESDGVTCSLQDSDVPSQVRGVAAVTMDGNDFNPPTFTDEDSGDAHRATGYQQDPVSLTIDPATHAVSTPQGSPPNTYPCSNAIVAQVFDQQGRPVKGVNVDVHAQGPSDGLQFDDATTSGEDDNSSPNQAPNSGNHTTERTVNCETPTTPPLDGTTNQGDHELQGNNDMKHIESAAGTDESGKFTFKLNSDTSGVTQFTVFADKDDNDLYCSFEPHADGSIGWGVVAPAASGVSPDQTTCATPTPPTPTPTRTTPSPTPTNTSPSPTPTNTSPSPTPTNTDPPPPPPPVTHPSKNTMNYDGNSFDGKVSSPNRRCRGARSIVAKKKRPGPDKKVGSDRTNRRGRYSIVVRRADGTYYTIAKRKAFTDASGRRHICRKDRSPNKRV